MLVMIQGYKKSGSKKYQLRTIKVRVPKFVGRIGVDHLKRQLAIGSKSKDLSIGDRETYLFESSEQDVLICVE